MISQDMGVDRDGLVNQALFAFARQHGYLQPSAPRGTAEMAAFHVPQGAPTVAPPQIVPQQIAPQQVAPPQIVPPQIVPPLVFNQPSARAVPTGAVAAVPEGAPSLTPSAVDPVLFEDPLPPLSSPLPRMATHASVPIAFNPAALPSEPPPQLEVVAPALDLGAPAPEPEPEPVPEPAADAAAGTLVLYAEGREVDRVMGPRFLIGRGKHCDLIINSGKVSREHAAIIREGDIYFIEDLGSSNGTWFDKKRISRRQIDNGDEYFVCSEKITCRFE
jgi:hypothetical protein